MPPLSRRAALAGALALLAAPRRARAAPRFVGEPFTLGVASGWPTPTGVSLWTRLAPAPLSPDGGMDPVTLDVDVEVAEDEAFASIVHRDTAPAVAALAHSVHADVDGLRPGRWYFYRFRCGSAVSPTGRTRTADAPGVAVQRLRFGLGSCQHFEQGWYCAHRHLLAEDLDLMLFVGDYIYEASWGRDLVRAYAGGEARTLADYRVRWAQHRTDPDLQRLHAVAPWLCVWDDHEVANDWAADRAQDLDPRFLERRAAAFQAWFEHLPVPLRLAPQAGATRIHERFSFGDLATFYLLDDRQHRSPQACPDPRRGGGSTVVDAAACAALRDPARTMLGADQEAWLDRALVGGGRWNVLVQQTLMSPSDSADEAGAQVWTDGWSGYPAARQRLLDSLRRRKARNPLVVGGDIHATWVSDLRAVPDDPKSPVVASEFCGTSITSQGMDEAATAAARARNPAAAFIDGVHRGYLVFELTPGSAGARVRAVDATRRDGGVETIAAFRVADGAPGVRPA